MVRATHTVSNGGVEGLMERVKKLAEQKVCVGVPSNEDNRSGGDLGNADLVYIHTHGVRPRAVRTEMQPEIDRGVKYSTVLQMYLHEHGSFAYQVPARPIIEPAIEDAKASIGKLLIQAAKSAMNGQPFASDLQNAGIYASNEVKGWFTNAKNGWPPNSESTIKRKKSSKPLIDTGALRQSITYIVRGKGE